ncbi:MAG: hypothetical protein IJ527_09560 [Prevotella sp.]|nr:hypothetical protein [Prevotella sp.]
MKKRIMMLLMAVLGMVMQSSAQVDMEVSMPNVKKVVSLTAKKATLWKQAKAKSGRVGTLEKGREMLVIGEQGEWYQVYTNLEPGSDVFYNSGVMGYEAAERIGYVGYVQKKLCKNVVLDDISQTDGNGNTRRNAEFKIFKDGKYAGLCLLQIQGSYFLPQIWVGKLVDNYYVVDRIVLVEDLTLSIEADGWGGGCDLDKLRNSDIRTIINNATVIDDGACLIYLGKGKSSISDGNRFYEYGLIYFNPINDKSLMIQR